MLKTCKNLEKRSGQAGFIPLVVLLVVALSTSAIIGGFSVVKRVTKQYPEIKVDLKKAIQAFPNYLDKEKLEDAKVEGDLLGTALLPDGSFSTYKVIEANISGESPTYQGETKVSFLSGDVGIISSDEGKINPFFLKDGSKVEAVIVDRLIGNLVLENGTNLPIKIIKGKVVNGRLSEVFRAQTYSSGHIIVGQVDENGRLIAASVALGAERASEAETVVAAQALGLFQQISQDTSVIITRGDSQGLIKEDSSTSGKVLGIKDNNRTSGSISPLYDEEKGTWTFAGPLLAPSTAQITNITNYFQKMLPFQIESKVSEKVTEKIIEGVVVVPSGIEQIKSESARLTATTKNRIATLSLDLAGITADVSKDSVKSEHIKDGEVKEGDIAGGAVSEDKLAGTLSFDDGDFLNLSAIVHDDSTVQGLRLPNATSASPTSPSTGEGYIAWDTSGNQIIVYNGSSWTTVVGGGSGDITSVTAGNGLSGGGTSGDVSLAISLTTSGGTGSTSSNSGLEVGSSGLALLKGCSNNQILKWDNTNNLWQCAADSGGGGSIDIQEGDTTVTSSALSLDFLAADFTVTDSPTGEANVSIDYTNSKIVRSDQSELITGGWTFGTNGTTFNSTATFNTDVDLALAGTENLAITSDLATTGTLNVLSLIGTPSSSAGTTRGVFVQQANSANTNGLDTAILIDNTDLDLALGTAIQITNSGGGGYTTILDTPSLDISGTGAITGATGISSSGTITFSGLTADRLVATTTGGQLTTSISSANLALSVSEETGSGLLVFGTSPTIASPTITTSPTAAGATWADLGSVTTIDINGGTIDGVTIGGTSAGAGTFTTLTATGDVTMNDAGADTILIGQSGATDDTVTIAGNVSITDDNWAISATGVGTNLTANDLSCTNCIGATEIDESTISSTSLSDGANIAHINAAEIITGGWTFNTLATTFTTAINANGGITTSTTDTSLAFTVNGAGDFTFTGDSDSNFQINATPNSDATLNSAVITLNPTGTGSTGTLQGLVISQSDNANTGVYDTLLKLENLKTPETTTNGLLIEQNAASGILANALHITNTAGTLTSAIVIDGTAPASFILDTGSIDITGAGAITGATGVSTTTLTATGDVTMNDAGADNILIGAAADTVTITSDLLSLTDNNWSIGTGGVISTTSTLNVDSTSTLNAVTLDANADLTFTSGTGSLVVNSSVSNASDQVIDIAPAFTGGVTDLLTYTVIDVAAFAPTNAAGTDTVNVIEIANLTDPGATITSTALKIGSGWDTAIVTNGGNINAGAGTVTAGTLSCNSGTCIAESAITDGTTLARVGSAETITGGWTFNTATTTFTTAINANGGINSAAATNIAFTPGTIGDVIVNVDADTLLSLTGGTDGTDALNIAAGNVTLSDGDLTLSGGDFNVTLDVADTINISKSGANAGDILSLTSSSTNSIDGVDIALTSTADTLADTYQALNISWTESTDADTFTALNIGNTTTTNSSTTAISIGTGWDTGITVGSGGITISAGALAVNSDSITSDGALVINATSTDIQDAVTVDSLTADTGGVTIAAGQSYTGAGAVTLSSAATTALTIDSGTTGAINIGTSANAKTITVGNSTTTTSVVLTKGASGNITLTGFNCTTFSNGGALTTDVSGNVTCSNDDSGAGGGIATVEEGNVDVVTTAVSLDFLGADFAVTLDTGEGSNEADVAIDYTNSGITRKGQAETITGGWTFNTAATTFTTAINANGGINSAAATNISFTPGTTGDVVINVDADTLLSLTGGADGTDALNIAAGNLTLTDGDLILSGGDLNVTLDAADILNVSKTAANAGDVVNISGTSANAIQGLTLALTSSADTLVDAYQGLNITWTESTDADTFTALNIGNTTTTNSGTTAISIGTGWDTGISVSSGGISTNSLSSSGAIAANGGITFDQATDTLGAHTLSGTLDANTNILTNIGNVGTDFIATTGALTLAGDLTLSNNTLVCTGCIDATDMAANSVDDSELVDALIYTGALTLTPGTTTDFVFNGDQDSNVQLTNTLTSDATSVNSLDFSTVINAAAGAATVYGVNINQADNAANTAVVDAIVRIQNANAAEITTNGLLIEQTGAGTLTAAFEIKETAGAITDGILITGTLGNILNSAAIDITGAGAITGATGVTTTTLSSTGVTTIGNNTATVAIDSSDWDITTTGAMTGIGAITIDGNFSQTGATTFSTGTGAITLNGAVTANTDVDLSLAATENLTLALTQTTEATVNSVDITFTDNAAAGATTIYLVNVTNADNAANTGVPDALGRFVNANAAETVPDGLIIEQSGAGTLTNGLRIVETAGAITTGINLASAFTNGIDAGTNSIVNVGDAGTDITSTAMTLGVNLTLSGDASEGLSGGGLVDCDTAATSKLLWDITTNKFSCGTDQNSGGATAWDAINDPAGAGIIAMAQTDQNLDWNMASDAVLNALEITMTHDVSDTTTQKILVIANLDDALAVGSLETMLSIDNRDANETVTNGLLVENTGAGTMTNAIQVAGTAGTITTAILVADGAGTITTGLSFTGTFTNLIDAPNFDVNNAGNITVAAAEGIDVNAAGALEVGDVTATSVSIGSTAATTLNLGAGGALTRTINIGTGTGADTINIGTGATGADVVTIGANVGTIAIDTTNFDVTSAGAVTLTGHLTLSADASEGLSGGGLVDCDVAATSKLLWDITTNKFSCGTDQTGGGGLPNTETFTDNTALPATVDDDATNYWNDATQPNITPAATTDTVLLAVQIKYTAVGAADSGPAFQIRRNIGADAACSSTLVGGPFSAGFTTSAGQVGAATAVFLDSPATTSNVRYTICASVDTFDTGDTLNSITVTLIQLGADLAENYYTNDDSIGPGDVVAIDPTLPAGVKKASKPYDSKALGVVSTAPGITLDDALGLGYGRPVPVALAGRIPVKVSTENGRVKTGDLLTPSSIPGVAMKATKAGQIIGQALQNFSYPDSEIGLVVAFVKTDYALGSKLADLLPGLTQDGVQPSVVDLGKLVLAQFISQKEQFAAAVELSEIVTDRIAAGVEVITPKVVTQSLSIDQIAASTGSDVVLNLTSEGKFVIRGQGDGSTGSPQAVISFDSQGNAYFAGVVTADKVRANQIEGLEILTNKITSLSQSLDVLNNSYNNSSKFLQVSTTNQEATGSAEVAGLSTSEVIAQAGSSDGVRLGNIEIESAKVTLDLTVLGTLYTQGALVVAGPAEFGSQTSFKGKSIFEKLVSFVSNVIFQGDVEFLGRPTFNKDTAGFARVAKGADKVEVTFEREYAQVPLVNISITLDELGNQADQEALEQTILNGDIRYIVTRRTTKGFAIKLNKPVPGDLTFSWTALAVKDASTSVSQGVVTSAQAEEEPTSTASQTLTPTPEPTALPSPIPTPSIISDSEASPSATLTASSSKTITINDNELGFLRVREQPSIAAAEIGQVTPGQTFTVLSEEADWYKIEYAPGQFGWVSGSYVTVN